jgi:predicted nucleic acid-binding protein
MSDMILIDANIFLYAFCTLDTAKQLRAKDIVLSPQPADGRACSDC